MKKLLLGLGAYLWMVAFIDMHESFHTASLPHALLVCFFVLVGGIFIGKFFETP